MVFDAPLAAGAQPRALRADMGRNEACRAARARRGRRGRAAHRAHLGDGVVDVDVRAGSVRGRTMPLHVAAMCDAPESVRALLAGGAGLTATGPRNMTALHAAIESGSTLRRRSRSQESGWR